uniref:EF-hand domain-containing protein n=1 Tax=Macrostomum lignano TaxID=282301 RepID=A0A1I8JG40_9PLAT
MKEAFSMLDNTGTLRIPASMLVNAALQVAECPDPKQVFQHVQQTRLSPQGSIDFNKFVGFMCGMVPYERPRDRLISCLKPDAEQANIGNNFSREPLFKSMSEYELADLKQSFAMYDLAGDLSIPGLCVARAVRYLACSPNIGTLLDAIRDFGIQDSDQVSFEDYAGLVNSLAPFDSRSRLVQCLQVLALNTRTISRDLLRRSLMSFGATMPEEEIDELLAGVPADADGNIDIHRMADFLLS